MDKLNINSVAVKDEDGYMKIPMKTTTEDRAAISKALGLTESHIRGLKLWKTRDSSIILDFEGLDIKGGLNKGILNTIRVKLAAIGVNVDISRVKKLFSSGWRS